MYFEEINKFYATQTHIIIIIIFVIVIFVIYVAFVIFVRLDCIDK